jgi:hypothetical protein
MAQYEAERILSAGWKAKKERYLRLKLLYERQRECWLPGTS